MGIWGLPIGSGITRFPGLVQDAAAFCDSINAVKDDLGIDGIDFDIENGEEPPEIQIGVDKEIPEIQIEVKSFICRPLLYFPGIVTCVI